MRRKIALFFTFAVMFALFSNAADKRFTLLIDPGHGGRDHGAAGAFSKEKDINLNVALAFGKYVEGNCPDVKVVYTREKDVFIPLYQRAEIANRNKADLFISIHTNALEGGKIARGFETYTLGDGKSQGTKKNLDVAKRENSVILLEKDYKQNYVGFDPNSPESNIMFEFVQDKNLAKSIDIAKMLQRNVCSIAGRPDKGVHQENFAVLRLTSMPACLIELGFITTPDEERQLNDKNTVDLIAKGIYNAFVQYKNKYDKSFVVPYKAESQPIESKQEPQTSQQPEAKPENSEPQKPEEAPKTSNPEPQPAKAIHQPNNSEAESDAPVFKIQILASGRNLKDNDAAFKGLTGCEAYSENGLNKYTYGASTNYNEIYRLRKQIIDKFPEAFIVAFKNGNKMNAAQAVKEFKQNRKK